MSDSKPKAVLVLQALYAGQTITLDGREFRLMQPGMEFTFHGEQVEATSTYLAMKMNRWCSGSSIDNPPDSVEWYAASMPLDTFISECDKLEEEEMVSIVGSMMLRDMHQERLSSA